MRYCFACFYCVNSGWRFYFLFVPDCDWQLGEVLPDPVVGSGHSHSADPEIVNILQVMNFICYSLYLMHLFTTSGEGTNIISHSLILFFKLSTSTQLTITYMYYFLNLLFPPYILLFI